MNAVHCKSIRLLGTHVATLKIGLLVGYKHEGLGYSLSTAKV